MMQWTSWYGVNYSLIGNLKNTIMQHKLCKTNILLQNNISAIQLERYRKQSSTKRPRHISILYFYVTDKLQDKLWLQFLIVPPRRWLAIIRVNHCKDHYFVPIGIQSWASTNRMKPIVSMYTNHVWNTEDQKDDIVPLFFLFLFVIFQTNFFYQSQRHQYLAPLVLRVCWEISFLTFNMGASKRWPQIYIHMLHSQLQVSLTKGLLLF